MGLYRLTVLVLALAIVACSSTPRKSTPPADAEQLSKDLFGAVIKEHRPPGPGETLVRVSRLRAVDRGILGLGRAFELQAAEIDSLRRTGALDVQAEKNRTADAETRLASPWRNPWIVIPVALAIGFGVGVGLAFTR